MEWQRDPHDHLPFEEWQRTKQLQQPADPFTVRRVDPDRIEHVTVYTHTVDKAQDGERHPAFTPQDSRFAGFFRAARAGAVLDGEWDRPAIPFEEYLPYVGLRRHFQEGVDWEETRYYRRILDCIGRGLRLWGCATEAEFRERCGKLDRLYERIDRGGYRSAADLREGRLQYDEIAVNVGRDGRLLFNDGKHRLSMAKLLGVDAVPVRVIVRHQGWVEETDRAFPE